MFSYHMMKNILPHVLESITRGRKASYNFHSEEQHQKYHIDDVKSTQIWPKLLIGYKASVTIKSFPKAVFKRKREEED